MAIFVEWLLANLPAFLKLLPKDKLIAMALQLGSRMGVVVEATVPGIMAAVRGWVTSNPQLALFVANVAATFGFVIADKLLTDVATEAGDGSRVQVATQVVLERLREFRQTTTGDGSSLTVNGRDAGDAGSAEDNAVIYSIIDEAVRSIGSFDMLMAIRTAMFMEDADLEAYRLAMKVKRN